MGLEGVCVCVSEHPDVCEHVFVCGVNISVKRRGHTDHHPRTVQEREQLCALRQTQKHAGRLHNNSLLSGLSLSALLSQLTASLPNIQYVYTFPSVSSMAVTPCTSLSSDNFMLLFASQPSCLAACAIQAYWAEERQFGSTRLPADRCYSSHCHSLRDFLLTRRACWDGGWDCVSRHNLLNLVLLAMRQSHGNLPCTQLSSFTTHLHSKFCF